MRKAIAILALGLLGCGRLEGKVTRAEYSPNNNYVRLAFTKEACTYLLSDVSSEEEKRIREAVETNYQWALRRNYIFLEATGKDVLKLAVLNPRATPLDAKTAAHQILNRAGIGHNYLSNR